MADVAARVYVWLPNSHGVGHAAMHIGSDQSDNTTANYVSWWPEEGAGMDALLPGRMYTGSNSTYADDVDSENGLPNTQYNLYDLDVAAMSKAWSELSGKHNAHYRGMRKNCATAVARILRAGGAADLAAKGILPSWDAHRVYWTPKMVGVLAAGIVANGHGNKIENHRTDVKSNKLYRFARMV